VIIGTAWTLNTILTRPKESLAGTVIVLLGIPGFLYWKRTSKRKAPAVSNHSVGVPDASKK
jgi:ABC-type Fe3+-siderophore transport system permease subunit